MSSDNLSEAQQDIKRSLDTHCNCGSGKKYGYCHGGDTTCYCDAGLLGKEAKTCHYNPSEATHTGVMAETNQPETKETSTVSSRDDADDGGDFMVE